MDATNKEPSLPLSVKVGTHVELDLFDQSGSAERLSVEIVEDQFADYEAGFLGSSTPLARAILGQPVNRRLPYRVGDLVAVHILSITSRQKSPDEDRAERREATIQKAVLESDRTNALLFASSFSGKWGDYDPKGVEAWDEDSSIREEKTDPRK